MATASMKTDAQKVADYRKQAMDKSLPQEVRDQADMKANEIEAKAAGKAGVKLAKGGVVKPKDAKTPPRINKLPMPPVTAMAKGGAVVAKAPMKTAEKQPMKKPIGKTPALVIAVGVGKPKAKTAMAKGGMAKKGKC